MPEPIIYKQVLIDLSTVLLLVKEMHQELISQIESLPLGEVQENILSGLREHADLIREEDIL